MPASNATSRFSDRVENYVRYRPGYPLEALHVLKSECRLEPGHVIADVASGTGIWARMLLEIGNKVFGIEPNPEMRQAGERLLAAFKELFGVIHRQEQFSTREFDERLAAARQRVLRIGSEEALASIQLRHRSNIGV